MAYQSLNPFTEEVIRDFPNSTDAEVEAAVAKADALFRSDWSKGDRAPRLAVLDKLAGIISANRDNLAHTMAEEMGKPLFQGQMEADLCAEIARYYADHS